MSNIDIFKMNVRKYNDIEAEIKSLTCDVKPYNEKLKILKNSKKELENEICYYMSNNDIDQCKLEEGYLVHKEKKSIIPLKKKNIHETLNNFFKKNFDENFMKLSAAEKADKLFNFIYKDNREFLDKSSLNRII